MSDLQQLAALVPGSTPELICASVARIFGVKKTEVALLEATGSLLKFLYPAELKTAGAIPISSSAVAASTARNKQSDIFNHFTEVKHSSIFEVIKLGDTGSDGEIIQKLMTAPLVTAAGDVVGVIQVSRKGHDSSAAGPDFTNEDLRRLESVAVTVAKVMSGPIA